MTSTFEDAKRMRLLYAALVLFLVSLVVSCATTMPASPNFLNSTDTTLSQWLDTRLDVDLAEVRIMHLPLTDAFAGMKLAIAQADAPMESLKVTLHANDVTRRQALWLLAGRYGLKMSVERVSGQPSYIGISK